MKRAFQPDSLEKIWKARAGYAKAEDLQSPLAPLLKFLPKLSVKFDSVKKHLKKEKITIPDLINLLKYKEPFDRNRTNEILELLMTQAQNAPDMQNVLVLAAVFQLLSRLYVSAEHIDPVDFSLFMQIANAAPSHQFSVLIFDFLMQKAKMKFNWEEVSIAWVIQFFKMDGTALTADFFGILLVFIDALMELHDKRYQSAVIDLVYQLIKENKPIVRGKIPQLVDAIPAIDLLVCTGHPNTMSLIGCSVQHLGPEKMVHYFNLISTSYAQWISPQWELVAESPKTMHELPCVDESHVVQDEKEMIQVNQNYQDKHIPVELLNRESVACPTKIDSINKTMQTFIECLNSSQQKQLFEMIRADLDNCKDNERYCVYMAFFRLLKSLNRRDIYDWNYSALFDYVLFDKTRTVFGPKTIDAVMNEYRACVIETVGIEHGHLVNRFVNESKNYIFMLAELAARIWMPQTIPLSIVADRVTIKLFSDTLVKLRNEKYGYAPRNMIFQLFFEMFQRKCKISGRFVFSQTYFVNSFMRFLYERGMTDTILNVMKRSFSKFDLQDVIQVDVKSQLQLLIEAIQFLKSFIGRVPAMSKKVFTFVIETVSICPALAMSFSDFLDLFMQELESNKTAVALKNAMSLLSIISSVEKNYILSSRYMNILAASVTENDYPMLLNLIAGSLCSGNVSSILIHRPRYMPLMFVALGKNRTKMNKFLNYLKALGAMSYYNIDRMHDGGVDVMLLKYLAGKSVIQHMGLNIEIHADRALVLEIITMIASQTGNSATARQFIDVITDTKAQDLIDCFHKCIIAADYWPRNRFLFGTIDYFAKVEGLTAANFMGHKISVSFTMKQDNSVLFGSPALIYIVKIQDSKKCALSISMINGAMFAMYEAGATKTIVPLCQRLTANEISRYSIIFHNDVSHGKIVITTTKDGEILHDSEFMPIKFENGPVTVFFGGHNFENRVVRLPDTVCGTIYDLHLYTRGLTRMEVEDLGVGGQVPPDYVFSMTDFSGTKGTNKPRPIEIVSKYYTAGTLTKSVQNPTNIRRLMLAYMKTGNLALLSCLIRVIYGTKDKSLPTEMASLLRNRERDYTLYIMLFNLVKSIEDPDVKLIWFEDVLINLDLWDKNDKRIMNHWNTVLLSEFDMYLEKKSYFRYFMRCLDDNTTDECILFLKRIGHRKTLCKQDVSALFAKLFEHKENDDMVSTYLSVIRDLGDVMRESSAEDRLSVAHFVKSKNPDVSILAIEAIASIIPARFCFLVPFIMENLVIDAQIFEKLEESSSKYPIIFALNCAIVLSRPDFKINKFPLVMPTCPLWYLYPVILYYNSVGDLRDGLLLFLTGNVARLPEQVESVIFLMMLLNDYSVHAEFNPCQLFVNQLVDISQALGPTAQIEIFWGVFAATLFRIRPANYVSCKTIIDAYKNSVFYHDESLTFVTGTHAPPTKITDTESLRRFVTDHLANKRLVFEVDIVNDELFDMDVLTKALSISQLIPEFHIKGLPSTLAKRDFIGTIRAISIFVQRNKCLQENVNHMNNVFGALTNLMAYNYSMWITDRYTGVKSCLEDLLSEVKIVEPSPVKIQGRVSGVFDIQRTVSTVRSHMLSDRCPCNFVRVKSLESVPRLLCQDTGASVSAIQTQFLTKIPINISIGDVITIQYPDTDTKRIINFSDIWRVLFISERSLSVITLRGDQYLLDLPYSIHTQLCTALKKHCTHGTILGTSLETMKTYVNAYLGLWKERKITSFEYLCALNEFAGRSYADASVYPVFPSVNADLSCIGDESLPSLVPTKFADFGKETNVQFDDRLLVLPEFYYSSEFSGVDPLTVYKNRKHLESRQDLHLWIEKVFSRVDYPIRNVFSLSHPIRDREPDFKKFTAQVNLQKNEEDGKIIFCGAMKPENRQSCFVCVYESGRVSFVVISMKEMDLPAAHEIASNKINDAHMWQYFARSNGLVAYNNKSVVLITVKGKFVQDHVFLKRPWFSDNFCQTNATSLSCYEFFGSKMSTVPFVCIPSSICCVATSSKFHITVVGCEDCKLRIRSNDSGCKIATVSLDNEVPVRVLITESWGFIVVKTNESIFVFTSNGRLIKKVANARVFSRWSTFRNVDGFDFVVYTDTNATGVFYFEVMYPEYQTNTENYMPDIAQMAYNWDSSSFIVVCESGKTIITKDGLGECLKHTAEL